MKDNEIKKALEVCAYLEACADCPFGDIEGVDKCMHSMMQNALDLLNRQQAEIERLQKETERFADIGKMYSEIKAEAIKEFAERLKEVTEQYGCYILKTIDTLEKETAGDAE